MTRQVSFHRLAKLELDEAADYYELQSPNLGLEFLDEVERCIRAVLESPESAPVMTGYVRRRLMPPELCASRVCV